MSPEVKDSPDSQQPPSQTPQIGQREQNQEQQVNQIENQCNISSNFSYLNQIYVTATKAIPNTLSALVWFTSRLFTISVIGHDNDETKLAGITLGFTFMYVTGWSVTFGIAGALDTYCSQAYTGNRKRTGIYLQKFVVITTITCIPIALLFYKSALLLQYLGQNPEVTMYSQLYTRVMILDLLPSVLIIGMMRFFSSQKIFWPQFIMQLVLLPLFCGSQYYMVRGPLGYIGAPLAVVLCDCILVTGLILYGRFFDGYQAWSGFSREAYTDLGDFCKLALNSTLQVCTEWWAGEIATILIGLISVTQLAAQAVLVSTATLLWTTISGSMVVTSVSVGNYLGAKQANQAKASALIGLLLVFGIALICSITITCLRYHWAYVYTQDEKVIDILVKLIPVIVCGTIFDGLSGTAGGILRGLGHQNVGAIVSCLNYYLVAIPLAIVLAFKYHLEIYGVVAGFFIGYVAQASILIIYLQFVDWEKAMQEAQVRVGAQKSQTEDNDLDQPLLGDDQVK